MRKKRKTISPTPAPELAAAPVKDGAILLRLDLRKPKSVLEHFPLVEGCGTKVAVPLQIRGFDSDYRNTFRKIREFRRMSKEQQEITAKSFSFNKKMPSWERALYNERIDAIESAKEELERLTVSDPSSLLCRRSSFVV